MNGGKLRGSSSRDEINLEFPKIVVFNDRGQPLRRARREGELSIGYFDSNLESGNGRDVEYGGIVDLEQGIRGQPSTALSK